jgi:glycosyl-4,4'-diaponeurosporenoate acyltransferase
MSTGDLVRLVLSDIALVAGVSILVGATAPRWPDRWLTRNRGPMRLSFPRRESTFRALGVTWLARRLPEFGAIFGGQSKATIPGRDTESLQRYLIEVRRAEWVHLVSLITFVPLAFFNPWWLTLVFAVITIAGNTPFLLILRYNRLRLTRLLDRMNR